MWNSKKCTTAPRKKLRSWWIQESGFFRSFYEKNILRNFRCFSLVFRPKSSLHVSIDKQLVRLNIDSRSWNMRAFQKWTSGSRMIFFWDKGRPRLLCCWLNGSWDSLCSFHKFLEVYLQLVSLHSFCLRHPSPHTPFTPRLRLHPFTPFAFTSFTPYSLHPLHHLP